MYPHQDWQPNTMEKKYFFFSIAVFFSHPDLVIWPHNFFTLRIQDQDSFTRFENKAGATSLVLVLLLLWFCYIRPAEQTSCPLPVMKLWTGSVVYVWSTWASHRLPNIRDVCWSNLNQVSPGSIKTSHYLEKEIEEEKEREELGNMNWGPFERYKETIVFKFILYLLLSAK